MHSPFPFPDFTADSAGTQVETAVRRIALRDVDVRAWTHIDAQAGFARAAQLDAIDSSARGALHGLPVGIKDVIDVAGMPTRHNSPLGNPALLPQDAPCVATLRAAGAIILGKTDTTEFAAAGRNAATANPHAFHRTPGGSSSGSAAAVADGHVPIALATQTGGSTIRPASFCGIHALKPSWGAISREGSKLYANSLDTIGLYAANIAYLDLLSGTYGLTAPAASAPSPTRIGLCRTPYWDRADAETVAAMDNAAGRLSAQGVEIVTVDLPPLFDQMEQAFLAILFREGAAAFLDMACTQPELLHADFHERVGSAARFPDDVLRGAYDIAAEGRRVIEGLMQGFDAFLTPSAPGIAPVGRSPGNPIFNQMWTMLHTPVLGLPLFRAQDDMPLGLSLVGPRFTDRALLRVGAQVEAMLGLHTPLG